MPFYDVAERETKQGTLTVDGTSLQFEMSMPYEKIERILGASHMEDGDGYKTDVEWYVRTPWGKTVTIYNYKDGKNYNGDEGLAKEEITDWHFGALEKPEAFFVAGWLLGLANERFKN